MARYNGVPLATEGVGLIALRAIVSRVDATALARSRLGRSARTHVFSL
jgi:hypothetical protein